MREWVLDGMWWIEKETPFFSLLCVSLKLPEDPYLWTVTEDRDSSLARKGCYTVFK